MLQMSKNLAEMNRRLVVRSVWQTTKGGISARRWSSTSSNIFFKRKSGWKLLTASTAVLLAGSYLTGRGLFPSRVANDSINSGTAGSGAGGGAVGGNRLSSSSTKQSITMLSAAQVSSRLRENEESYLVDRGKGVLRYDVSQLPSNNPIEDDRSERVVQVPLVVEGEKADDDSLLSESIISSDWMFWGVYDGHSGWTTSAFLRDHLIPYVLNELDKVYEKASPNSIYRLIPSPEVIDNAIERGFLALDDEIVNKRISKLLESSSGNSKASATELIAPALSGSCGLLAHYDTYSQNLRVAVTGDSRAVLGSRDGNGNWTATALSTDQTGSNIDEANRVRSEHPGEENSAIRHGRVLGSLEPTRAFGDARYKWARDIQHKIAQKFFGRRIPSDLKTPPYVTAKPVVTTTKIHPENGDFLVMGSDGIFEMLSNEEVVTLVVQWLKNKQPEYLETTLHPSSTQSGSSSGLFSKFFGSGKKSGSNEHEDGLVEDVSSNKEAQKQPIRRRAGVPLRFTVQDDNAATHVIRNALGGADQDQVSMLVSIPSPLARNYRDDLTVTVVFFGTDNTDPDDTGSIKVNQSATKNGIRVRSRL